MVHILSIETADKGCSVAVHKNGELLTTYRDTDGKSSSAALTLLIEACIKDAGITFTDLSAIAVSKGPGSYTGLRIGVSTAKGMCYALDIPLISINSLDTLAKSVSSVNSDFICPMLDARRMEVYCKLLESKSFETISETEALVLNEDSFQSQLSNSKILFCGPGSVKAKDIISHKNAIYMEEPLGPHASFMGAIAYEYYTQGKFEDLIEFEPFYLKDFMVKKSKKKMPLDEI